MSWLLPQLPPKWDAALRDVHAQDARARAAAAARLAHPAPEDHDAAVDALLMLAKDREPRVRVPAIEALGELADARAIDALRAATHDDDPYVREVSAIALGHLPRELVEPALLESATSPHPEVRFQAAIGLADLCPDHAVPVLRRLINDSDNRVRASAVRAADALPSETLGSDLLRSLAEALRDGDLHVRGEAAVLLAKLGDQRARSALIEALNDAELVWNALDAAPGLNDAQLIEDVAVIAQSFLRSRALKAAAARALIRMHDPRGVDALREVLTSLRSDGRTYAVEIVGELEVDALLPLLLKLMHRPRGVDPVVLARSLSKLARKHPEARRALTELATRDDEAGALSHAELSQLPGAPIAPSSQPPP